MILNGIRKAVRIIAYQEKGNTVSAANAEKEKKVILYHIDNRKGEKKMIKIGDKVRMNDKYHVSEMNKNKEFTVTTDPQMVCGTLCVWMDGFKGCYAADGLGKI